MFWRDCIWEKISWKKRSLISRSLIWLLLDRKIDIWLVISMWCGFVVFLRTLMPVLVTYVESPSHFWAIHNDDVTKNLIREIDDECNDPAVNIKLLEHPSEKVSTWFIFRHGTRIMSLTSSRDRFWNKWVCCYTTKVWLPRSKVIMDECRLAYHLLTLDAIYTWSDPQVIEADHLCLARWSDIHGEGDGRFYRAVISTKEYRDEEGHWGRWMLALCEIEK